MKTSARNQFLGTICALKKGAVNSEVVLRLDDSTELVAVITNESVAHLGLRIGQPAHALIKASSVILMSDPDALTSARNKLCGTVARCREGAVNGEVVVGLESGKEIVAVITNESIRGLGLKPGMPACALIKASGIILAID
jgi:molybdate transport system regulatory protein